MSDHLSILKSEFDAEEGSFSIKLRPHLEWDKAAFTRLIGAMQRCCEDQEGKQELERWLAFGFWYVPQFTRDWTSHPNFPKIYEKDYYEKAYQRLDDLAYWFFMGYSPYEDNTRIDPL